MKQIMVDLETLGTTADSAIVSVGAVRFDLETGETHDGFYQVISLDSNLSAGRYISPDTLSWWMQQEPEARAIFSAPSEPLHDVLENFARWIHSPDSIMWSNGADFDLPMLAHAYTHAGISLPWKYWNSRCFRTYKNLPGAKQTKTPKQGVKHNALADAYNQAQTLCAIHHALFVKGSS